MVVASASGRGWRAVASRRMRGRHAACVQVGRTPHAASIRGDDDCSPQPATPKENRSQVRLLSQAGTRAGAPQVAFGVTAPCRSSSRSARWEVAARTQGKAIAMHQQPSRASRGRENYLPMRDQQIRFLKLESTFPNEGVTKGDKRSTKGKRCVQVRATRDCELLIWVADDERAIRTLHIASPGHWHDVHARTKWDKRRQKVRDPRGRAAETGLRAIDICAQDNAIHTFQPRCLDVLSAAERVGHWHDFHAEARGNKRWTKGGSQVRAAKTGLRAMYIFS